MHRTLERWFVVSRLIELCVVICMGQHSYVMYVKSSDHLLVLINLFVGFVCRGRPSNCDHFTHLRASVCQARE